MGTLRVVGKIAHKIAESVCDTMRLQHGLEEIRGCVPKGHGGIARGDLHVFDDEIGHMGDEALQQGSRK